MTIPKQVKLVEVGPRDGLQNEAEAVPAAIKAELIHRLVAAGIKNVEAGAFVSPKWVPQMADSAEVLAALNLEDADTSYPVLVPNLKGLERALAANAKEIAVFAAASEAFSQRNINCSIAESLERFSAVCEQALTSGLRVRGYISCVLGCPYSGEVPPEDVRAVARELITLGCYEVSLGDTIGVGTPGATKRMLESVLKDISMAQVAGHFHDTYGQALANVYAALELGVATFDASVAGLGGCPYAKGATGNVASEELLYLLNGLGITTGIDMDELVATAWFISDHLGRPPNSRVARAMGRLAAGGAELADSPEDRPEGSL